MPLAHSYSSIKQFENCPRQYHEVRILKRFKSQDTAATMYGTAVHKAIEDHLMDGKDIPDQFQQFKPIVSGVAQAKGDRKCEIKMGIRADFTPCGFFDEDVWFRGIPDVLIVNGDKARVADWKTGKSSRYADTSQLELMAGMVFAHYPDVQQVKGALVFLVAGSIVQASYAREQFSEIMSKWAGRAGLIEAAIKTDTWNPKRGPLCKFCPVTSCDHHPG